MNAADIVNLEEKLRLAMLAGDVPVLDELISESLVFTAPTGDVVNKKMDLDCHRSGIQKLTQLNPSDQSITLYDNFAIVTVKMQLEEHLTIIRLMAITVTQEYGLT